MTLYEVVYGKKYPSIKSYLTSTSKVQKVETILQNRDCTLENLKDNLSVAQNHMKKQVDQHQSKWSIEVRDMVFLRLNPISILPLNIRALRSFPPIFMGLIRFSNALVQWPTSYIY